MALPDEIRDAQEMLNELWAFVQEQKELSAKSSADLGVFPEVSAYVDEAQEALQAALDLYGRGS